MKPSTPTDAAPFVLAIVGGGPRCTYALERLSATVKERGRSASIEVHVFDKAGDFGAGQVHSPNQPKTSVLNRVSSQVSFAADESSVGALPLRSAADRPTLYQWARERFLKTGDPAFDFGPTDWPHRYIHGLALQEQFETYVSELEVGSVVTVTHNDEVIDLIARDDGRFAVVGRGSEVVADYVLLVTGHSNRDAMSNAATAARTSFAARHGLGFSPNAYPISEVHDGLDVGPGTTVGLEGTGLTAIDHILHLTEGRGGSFAPDANGQLRYVPSGREPRSIVAFSSSGAFPLTRPDNHKYFADSPAEHRSRFFTKGAIDQLRAGSRPAPPGRARQLDFEADVLPLMIVEMAWLHYATLFGPSAAELFSRAVLPAHREFITAAPGARDPEAMLGALERAVDAVAASVASALGLETSSAFRGQSLPDESTDWLAGPTVDRWLLVVTGATERVSGEPLRAAWGLEADPFGNRFDWSSHIDPVGTDGSGADYHSAYARFLARDILWARQGNVDNPDKAALDGVWRDSRDVLSHVVDHGGLTAQSHRRFIEVYLRLNNKFVNGNCRLSMEKVLALLRAGVLDMSAGPGARVNEDEDRSAFVVTDSQGRAVAEIDVLITARVDSFDARLDEGPLYRRALKRGIVRAWTNRTEGQADYKPGYLELDGRSHPVGADGRASSRVTILGAPAAMANFFPFSAMRPLQDHAVMREMLVWVADLWAAYDEHAVDQQRRPLMTCPDAA